jgi:hypothetical protein
MARRRRQLDPEIQALVRKELAANERVEAWHELRPGEVIVQVIDQDLRRICRESVRRFGRGAGAGRTLQFRMQNEKWVFVGTGGWIS